MLLTSLGLFSCSDVIQPGPSQISDKIVITIRQNQWGEVRSSVASSLKWSKGYEAVQLGEKEIPLVSGRLSDRLPESGESVDLVAMEGKMIGLGVKKTNHQVLQWADSVKVPARVHLLSDHPSRGYVSQNREYHLRWLPEENEGDMLLQLRQRTPGDEHATLGKVIKIPEGGSHVLSFEVLHNLGFDTTRPIGFNLIRWEEYVLPAIEELPAVVLEIGCSAEGELLPE